MGIVLRRLLATSILLPFAAVSALAQFSMIPDLEYNPLLILDAKVQKELRIAPAAGAKLNNAFMEEAFKILPAITSSPDTKPISPQQRTKLMLEGIKRMQTRLASMLTPPQRGRLRQLTLQSIGPAAVLQPKVAASLGLSSTQRNRLLDSISAANARVASKLQSGQSSDQWQKQMGEMIKLQNLAKAEGNRALGATLTPAQKAKWKAMLGKPFPMTGFLGAGGLGQMLGGR